MGDGAYHRGGNQAFGSLYIWGGYSSTFQKIEDISIVFLRCKLRQSVRKNFGRSTAHSCRTNVFIEFHHFMKKE